jgi:DNA-binding GntR family transcriptional regulator
MRLDIKKGRLIPDSLAAMLEKQMVEQYGASRDTCRKARRRVLSEFIADK